MKKVDLPAGSVFGELTVLKMDRYKGRRACLCECSCGEKTYAYVSDLKNGRRKSCGCINSSIILGKKYGRLKAIAKDKIKNNKQHWKFKCECGKEVIRDGSKVRYRFQRNVDQSCGCSALGRVNLHARKKYGEAAANKVFDNYKRNASKKSLDFKLTKEQALDLMSKKCYYCGCKPSRVMSSKKLYGEFVYNGIDRLNNDKGYTLSNTVPCCTYCNYKKSNDNFEEFKEWIDKVYHSLYNE